MQRHAAAGCCVRSHDTCQQSPVARTSLELSIERGSCAGSADWAAFKEWQQRTQLPPDVQRASLKVAGTVAVVAGAATPAVLLLPVSAPLVFGEAVMSFFSGQGMLDDGMPLWFLRSSLALVAHPAVVVSCAVANAATFLGTSSFLHGVRGGWDAAPAAWLLEAKRVGRAVGLGAALISPVLVLAVHKLFLLGFLNGLMPRSLLVDYWAEGGGVWTFTYVCVAYVVGVPLCMGAGGFLAQEMAPALFAAGGPSRALLQWAGLSLGAMSAMSTYMHRNWEFWLLQNAVTHSKRTARQ